MHNLKDVLGRAEERSNPKALLLCTVVIVALVTLVFGISEFRFLFGPSLTHDTQTTEESTTLQTDQGGG